MSEPVARRLAQLAFLLIALSGCIALWQFLTVSLQRVSYPYELEWMEGAMLHQVWQLSQGLPLFGQPSMDFVPAIYMPLYYYLAEGMTRWLGMDFLALRVTSLLASVLMLAAIFVAARRLSRSVAGGWIAVAVMLSCYRYCGYWFDLARVDALWTTMLACTAASVLAWRDKRTDVSLLLAAWCYSIAIVSKQSSLFMLPFLVPCIWLLGGVRAVLIGGITVLVTTGLLMLVLSRHGNEQLWFYTLAMASGHGINGIGLVSFITQDTFLAVPAFLVVALHGLPLIARDARDRKALACLLAGFALVSWISRSTPGGYLNVLMPYACGLAIFCGAGLVQMYRQWSAQAARQWAGCLMPLLVAANMALGFFDPASQIPSAANRAAGDALVAQIRQIPGNVCVPSHGYLAWRAGKPFCAHVTQIWDVLHGSSPAVAESLKQDIRQRLQTGYYAALLIDNRFTLRDMGMTRRELPYAVSSLDAGVANFRPVVSGTNPQSLLSFSAADANNKNAAAVDHHDAP